MSDSVLPVARQFAAALDVEDYTTARALVSAECVYDIGKETIVGVDAIINSYARNGEQAKVRFDAIAYASCVEQTGPESAAIEFTDRVCLGGAWHEYHCRQHLSLNDAGVITSIRHEEIPGERDRLIAFEAKKKQGPSGRSG